MTNMMTPGQPERLTRASHVTIRDNFDWDDWQRATKAFDSQNNGLGYLTEQIGWTLVLVAASDNGELQLHVPSTGYLIPDTADEIAPSLTDEAIREAIRRAAEAVGFIVTD